MLNAVVLEQHPGPPRYRKLLFLVIVLFSERQCASLAGMELNGLNHGPMRVSFSNYVLVRARYSKRTDPKNLTSIRKHFGIIIIIINIIIVVEYSAGVYSAEMSMNIYMLRLFGWFMHVVLVRVCVFDRDKSERIWCIDIRHVIRATNADIQNLFPFETSDSKNKHSNSMNRRCVCMDDSIHFWHLVINLNTHITHI